MRGHIRKRGATYTVVLDVGYDSNGRRIRKWFGGHKTKRDAERFLTAKLAEIESGIYVIPSRQKFGTYMSDWLQDKRSSVREDTYRSYKWLVEGHIVPKLGGIQLQSLTPQHLQRFYTGMQQGAAPLSNRSVQFAHSLIRQALDRAMKWGLVGRNVADAVEPPRVGNRSYTTWTSEQVNSFLESTRDFDNRYRIAFVLAVMTGMRKSEILALRWSDINFKNSTASINRVLKWYDGNPRLEEPKTKKSRRTIALSRKTIEELLRHQEVQHEGRMLQGEAYQDYDLIVARPDGFFMHPKTLDDAWYRALDICGLPRIRFHDLRHTHASLLLQQGVHPKIVSERLGHSSIAITIDTYSHVIPGLQHDAAEQLDDLIFTPEIDGE